MSSPEYGSDSGPDHSNVVHATPATRRIAVVVTVLTVGVVGVVGAVRVRGAMSDMDAKSRAKPAASIRRARVVAPVATTFVANAVVTGALEPREAADLGFGLGGRIATVSVRLGDKVRVGDVLAVLDRRTISAQTTQASAGTAVATANLEMVRDRVQRLQALRARNAVSEAEVTAAEQQLALAQAQVTAAGAGQRLSSAATGDHVLRAPFAGVITRVPSGPGSVVGPGAPIFRLEDLSALKLRASVPADVASRIEIGGEVQILMPGSAGGSVEGPVGATERPNANARGTGTAAGETVTGRLEAVVRSLDPVTRRAPIEVSIDNTAGTLFANSFVQARITLGAPRRAWTVPRAAVTSWSAVYVAELDGSSGRVARTKAVVILDDSERDVIVDGPLRNTDQIVLRSSEVTEGVRIQTFTDTQAP